MKKIKSKTVRDYVMNDMVFKVDTPRLLKEIAECSRSTPYPVTFTILTRVLGILAERAIGLGARWAVNELLKDLWHPASEEPRKDVSIIVETHNDEDMFYYTWNRWQDNFYPSWTDAVLCSRVSRWLCIDDLLPKKGGEQ